MKNDDQSIRVFGIRHHGPGSARSLEKALSDYNPDIILIEGPYGEDALLVPDLQKETETPVAIVIYDPQNLNLATFYPYACFSPEWIAIQYGLENNLPVKFIDLPPLIIEDDDELNFQITGINNIHSDPLLQIAQIAGFDDPEAWWDATFESASWDAVFELLSALMTEIRATSEVSTRTRQREAWMRIQIRKAKKRGCAKIAVFCGAWHMPALEKPDLFKESDDKKLTKNLKFRKTTSAWIPWNYERLSKKSGYSAGVIAPMFYEFLFTFGKETPVNWIAYTALKLREKGHHASTASTIDAVNLSDNLTSIRGRSLPGFIEITEASSAVFGYADSATLRAILKDIPIGNKVGKVTPGLMRIPIQQDFDKQVTKLRLSKELELTYPHDKVLDLRKDSHKAISIFLYRTRLINLKWAILSGKGGLGTFKEIWTLQWKPEYFIQIAESSFYGITIQDAAKAVAREQGSTLAIPGIVELIESCLNADLEEVIDDLIQSLNNKSVVCQDVFLMMETFVRLSALIRHGSSKKINFQILTGLNNEIFGFILAHLHAQVSAIEIELSVSKYPLLVTTSRELMNNSSQEDKSHWIDILKIIAFDKDIENAFSGASLRLLSESGKISHQDAANVMSRILSNVANPDKTSSWLNGYLQDNPLILLYNKELWALLNHWVESIEADLFQEIVPLLRKAFYRTEEGLKLKIMNKVRGKRVENQSDLAPLNSLLTKSLEKLFNPHVEE
jgi:hypothetical protein